MTIPSRNELKGFRDDKLKDNDDEIIYHYYLEQLEQKLLEAAASSKKEVRIEYWSNYWIDDHYDEILTFGEGDNRLDISHSQKLKELLLSKGYSYKRLLWKPWLFNNIGVYVIYLGDGKGHGK